eukprot:4463597-Prymnesium_polylepis.1
MLEIDAPSNYWINMFNFSALSYPPAGCGVRHAARRRARRRGSITIGGVVLSDGNPREITGV